MPSKKRPPGRPWPKALRRMSLEDFAKLIPPRTPGIRSIKTSLKGTHIAARLLGNFTIVSITKGEDEYVGVAKRNGMDEPSNTGMVLAATRAFRNFKGIDPGYCRQTHTSAKANLRARMRAMQKAATAAGALPKNAKVFQYGWRQIA